MCSIPRSYTDLLSHLRGRHVGDTQFMRQSSRGQTGFLLRVWHLFHMQAQGRLRLDGSALLGWKWGSVCLTWAFLLMLTAGLDYITHINPHAAATVEIKDCWILISWEAKNLRCFRFTIAHCQTDTVGNLSGALLSFLSDELKQQTV